VFGNVWDLQGELGAQRTLLQIQDIHRREPENDGQRAARVQPWLLEGHDLELTLLASGFRQHFRSRAAHTASQRLEFDARGGISFDQSLDFPA
jgi:hypothetical protein